MPAWPDLFRIERFRFNARVARELARRQDIDGDRALALVVRDLERSDLRSRYREILQAVAERLRQKDRKAPRTLIGAIPLMPRSKPGKSATSS